MKKKLRAFFKDQAAYNFVVPPIVAALFRALRLAVGRVWTGTTFADLNTM
jgi:hypothetical protein